MARLLDGVRGGVLRRRRVASTPADAAANETTPNPVDQASSSAVTAKATTAAAGTARPIGSENRASRRARAMRATLQPTAAHVMKVRAAPPNDANSSPAFCAPVGGPNQKSSVVATSARNPTTATAPVARERVNTRPPH
nr:hypothetical protein GCM10025730_45990 [Promicromonospora thailandica]